MLDDVDTDEDVDTELDVDTLQKHYMYINLSICWSNKEVGFSFIGNSVLRVFCAS